MSVGNHEVWGDPKIEGTLAAMPYLKNFGVTPERLIYKFDFRDIRFIFLWSGKYDYRSPSLWDADRPKYAEQIVQLQQWLDDGRPPQEEYNYVLVDVAPGEKTKFILTRYRPGSAEPFATEALFS